MATPHPRPPSRNEPEPKGRRPRRYLHIVPDDKFVDGARMLFERVAPGASDYWLLSNSEELRYVKTFQPDRRDALAITSRDAHDLNREYATIFVHCLNASARLLIDKLPESAEIKWIGWGADYYHLICPASTLLLPQTGKLVSTIARATKERSPLLLGRTFASIIRAARNPEWAFRRYKSLRRLDRIGPGKADELAFLERIKAFAPVVRGDFDAMKLSNPSISFEFLLWNYPVLEYLTPQQRCHPGAKNLLIGNSATPENNHLDTFQLIEGSVRPDCQILCPLSYGSSSYGDAVEEAGIRTFGPQFVPLREYLTLDAYIEILSSCSIVAMNHVRQQALGNILMMLWMGARVFLNMESPVYAELASIGIDVLDIRSLPAYLRDPSPTSVSLEEVRSRLQSRYGRATLEDLTRKALGTS